MTRTLKTIEELALGGVVARDDIKSLKVVAERYAVALTPELGALIERGVANDPIARQFVPDIRELETRPEERLDPIGDDAHSPVPGIVHRHIDRVLFRPVLSCPVYCRFCFRREQVGQGSDGALSPATTDAALRYIAAHPEIREVILTGGDPFILSPRRMAELSQSLAGIPHVSTLRWHTRVPVVDPLRVNDELVAALIVPNVTTWVVIHANHSREFTSEARAAIARLVDAGIPLLSQSVLLNGVNADIDTLEALMRTFLESRIKPYYLHHPDLAPGTAHFQVSIEDGQDLMRELRGRITGLGMPDYVLDIPGGYAKVSLTSNNAENLGDGRYCLRDHDGRWHRYPPEA